MTDSSPDDPFQSEVDWSDMFERQVARGDFSETIREFIELNRYDHVISLGCGPGYPIIRFATANPQVDTIGLDHEKGALEFLATQATQEEAEIRLILGDIAALPIRVDTPIAILLAFVVHHLDTPRQAIETLGGAVPPESPVLILEYDPDGSGDVGPPCDRRIHPRDCRDWLAGGGFAVERTEPLPEEKYAIVARRT